MTIKKTYVYVKTQFEGFHRWKGAPDEHAYLRDWHRHMFHVTLVCRVTEPNRQIEFLELKRELWAHLERVYGGWDDRFEFSCEQLAERVLDRFAKFNAVQCTVSEDDENGATVILDFIPEAK